MKFSIDLIPHLAGNWSAASFYSDPILAPIWQRVPYTDLLFFEAGPSGQFSYQKAVTTAQQYRDALFSFRKYMSQNPLTWSQIKLRPPVSKEEMEKIMFMRCNARNVIWEVELYDKTRYDFLAHEFESLVHEINNERHYLRTADLPSAIACEKTMLETVGIMSEMRDTYLPEAIVSRMKEQNFERGHLVFGSQHYQLARSLGISDENMRIINFSPFLNTPVPNEESLHYQFFKSVIAGTIYGSVQTIALIDKILAGINTAEMKTIEENLQREFQSRYKLSSLPLSDEEVNVTVENVLTKHLTEKNLEFLANELWQNKA